MRRTWKTNAAILSATSATLAVFGVQRADAQSQIANWSADTYTAPNWIDPISGTTGTGFGTNTLLAVSATGNPFGATHAALNVSAGGFTLPKSTSFPPAGLTSFTVASVFDPTAAQTTGGAGYQVAQILGYDIGGAAQADFTVGYGGATGKSFIAGGGSGGIFNGDYTLTSQATTLNTVHSIVFQEEDPSGLASQGNVLLYIDGAFAAETTGLTIAAMNPAASTNTLGLAGTATNNAALHLPGVVGTVQVYNDSTGVSNPVTLGNSLVTGYNGVSQFYSFSGTSGALSASANYTSTNPAAFSSVSQVDVANGAAATVSPGDATFIAADLMVGDSNVGTAGGSVTQTGGLVSVNNAVFIGQGNVGGTYTLTGGNLNFSGGNSFALQGNSSNPAVLTISTAGTLYSNGAGSVIVGEGYGSNGVANLLAGGTYNNTTGQTWVGDGAATGVFNIAGGTMVVNNWFSIGRLAGTGTVNFTAGSITKIGSTGSLDIGGDGAGSHGYFYQSGATTLTAASTNLTLADTLGDVGVYNISGGSTATVGAVQDGQNGAGTINITGSSTITSGNSVEVGRTNGAVGILNIGSTATGDTSLLVENGGTQAVIGENTGATGTANVFPGSTWNITAAQMWIGNNGGVGTLNVSGGTVLINNWLAPGRLGGTGIINVTGGTLTKTGTAASNGNIDIAGDGANSHGYIYQTGGVINSVSSTVFITENNTTEVGVWNMSGGAIANVLAVNVGEAGNGTLNIGNATFNASGNSGATASSIGGYNATTAASGAVGVLNLTAGGTFTNATGQTFVGNDLAVGTVNISGGTLNVNNYLAPGRLGGTGTIYLSSGAINVMENDIVTAAVTGYNTVNLGLGETIIGGDGTGGKGYIYQSGGSFNSPNAVAVLGETAGTASLPSAAGVWNISGGTVILPSSALTPTNFLTSLTIGLGGNGTVNVSGTGQLTAGNVIIAQNAAGTTALASNGALNVSSVFSATNVLVGQGGNGTLNLTAGQFNASSVTLAVSSSSTGIANLSGGTLTTGGIAYGNGSANLLLGGTTLRALHDNSDFLSTVEATPLALNSALTLDTQTNKIGIQQSLSGPGPLTKLGTGTLTLSASNSYTGNTLVNAGTLTVANANALSTGTAVLANGATLALSAQSTTLESFANAYKTNQSSVFSPQTAGNDNAVTITVPQNSISNSVFLQDSQIVTVDDTKGFIANFTYNHTSQGPEQTGADGIAFILQNGSPTAAGGAGGSLGYNASGYSSSLAAAIDLFLDKVDLGSGNGSSGALTNSPMENSSPLISQTTSSNVAVVYTPGASGAAGMMTITMTNSSGGVIATNSQSIDAAVALGGSAGGTAQAYIGFTGATGAANDLQSISDFSFNQNGTALSYTAVNINNAITVASTAASPASSTIQLAPTTNFSSGSVGPITIGTAGTLAISIGTSPAAGVTHGVLTTPSISFANGTSGTLDVSRNALDITGQSFGIIQGYVASGYANGTSNGPGLSSSDAASDSTHLTTLGVIINSVDGTTSGAALYGSGTALGLFEGISPASTDVLVKYTYFGDANLDGKVDGSDYSRIDSGYLSGATGWYNGDFNYDGVVNGSDYTLIDNAFNTQGASLAASLAAPSAVSTAEVAGAASAVPEPTTLGLLTIGAAGLLGRRRRHH